jgi:hypothetical protein
VADDDRNPLKVAYILTENQYHSFINFFLKLQQSVITGADNTVWVSSNEYKVSNLRKQRLVINIDLNQLTQQSLLIMDNANRD